MLSTLKTRTKVSLYET